MNLESHTGATLTSNVLLAQAKIGKSGKNKSDQITPSVQERNSTPSEPIKLENIMPLYTSPGMPGEGVWESTKNSPKDSSGNPILHKTFYRPSVDFPNAIVYMMIVDMSKVYMQYYVGSQEPAAGLASSEVNLICVPG